MSEEKIKATKPFGIAAVAILVIAAAVLVVTMGLGMIG
jgi:hypothetical protein